LIIQSRKPYWRMRFTLRRPMRKDYIVALTGAGSGPDPDQNLHLLYRMGAELKL